VSRLADWLRELGRARTPRVDSDAFAAEVVDRVLREGLEQLAEQERRQASGSG